MRKQKSVVERPSDPPAAEPERGRRGRKAAAAGEAAPRRRHHTPEERRAAIEAYRASGQSQLAFAANYGISPATLAVWLRAEAEQGPKGLERLATGPAKRRGRPPMSAAQREAIVEVKKSFPTFGLKKVRDFLYRFRAVKVSTGTVQKAIVAAGLPPTPAPKKKRRPAPPREFERARPGELWQTDITYLHVPWHEKPLYLVAFVDDFSRYVVSASLYLHQRQEIVIETYLEGVARFGKPQEVLSDQGRQYFAWRGKSDFQKLLRRDGVHHAVARAHHPETVGKCERLWETIKKEFWDRVQPKDLSDARARLALYLTHYNHFRTHQGIGGMTPADRFFGVESEVRRTLEATLSKNALRLAVDEPPRKPVFLVGQIGDESVSLHGERGRVVVQTADGVVREMAMDELGIPKGVSPSKDAKKVDSRKDAKEVRDGRADGRDGNSGGGAAAAARGAQANEVPGTAADADPGAGAVAGGDRGGAGAGARDGGGDPRGVAREGDARGGGGAAGDPEASVLAAVAAGGGGDGGGAPAPAAGAPRPATGGGDAARGGPAVAATSDRGVGIGAVGGAVADRDPARPAGAPGGRDSDDGASRCEKASGNAGGGTRPT